MVEGKRAEGGRRDETHALPRPGTQDNRCLSLLAQKPLYHALERDEALMQHNGSSGNTRGSKLLRGGKKPTSISA
jgi:hypothetical protein